MVTVFLSVGILAVVVFAVVHLRRAKTATPARCAELRNTAGMFLSTGSLFMGAWIGGIAAMPVGVPVVGWLIASLLAVLALALMVAGVVGGIRCIQRIDRIHAQLYSEANPWVRQS